MDDKKVLLSLKDVSIKFNVRGRFLTAIRNVSLDIYDKETIAIVGESGSGKSVLTKTFAGMLDSNGFISNGSIVFSDDELSKTVALNSGLNRTIYDNFLKKLNEFSYLEAGSAEYNAIQNEKEQYKAHFSLTEEEQDDFDERIKEANDNIIDCTNYINSLNNKDKNDAKELNEKKAELNQLNIVKANIIKEKENLLSTRQANARSNLREKMLQEIADLETRRNQIIAEAKLQELPEATIERNILICKEVILSISRYPFFSKMKFVRELKAGFKDAMCRGVNLMDEEERNKIFDKVVFRVKYLRDLTAEEVKEIHKIDDEELFGEDKPKVKQPKHVRPISLILWGLAVVLAILSAIPGNVTTVIIPHLLDGINNLSLLIKYLFIPIASIILFFILKRLLYREATINSGLARTVVLAPVMLMAIGSAINTFLWVISTSYNKPFWNVFAIVFLLIVIVFGSLFLYLMPVFNRDLDLTSLNNFNLTITIASIAINLICFLITKDQITKDTLLVTNNNFLIFGCFALIVLAAVYYYFAYKRIVKEEKEAENMENIGFLGHAIIDCAKVKFTKDWEQIRGRKIATVFQDPMTSLNPIITIGKQIMAVILKHQRCSYDEAKARAIDIMEKVGIPNPKERFNDYPFQYSGGMRQRIVIAIALSCQPKILICDEPTTALDVTIQAQIIRLIKDLQSQLGFTTVFITHDLGVVANVADRVAVLYGGQIVEIGTAEDVYFDPRHPYTWALLSSLPQLSQRGTELFSIPGTPPSLYNKIVGDAFAPRNKYAMAIDLVKEPPMFKVSETHYAKTWLLDERAPKVEKPENIQNLHEKMVKFHEGVL